MIRNRTRRTFATLLAACGLAMLAPAAFPQPAYPDRPVRMVVGFAAGGAADLIARVVATDLADRLGKPVIVENRPGAGSQVAAAAAVARADPLGYTLFFGSIALSVQMAVDPAMQLNPLTELAPGRARRRSAERPPRQPAAADQVGEGARRLCESRQRGQLRLVGRRDHAGISRARCSRARPA